MQNTAGWKPSKYVRRRGKLMASRSSKQVSAGSFLVADLTAKWFDRADQQVRGDLLDLGCGRVPLYGHYATRTQSYTCADWANSQHPNPHLDVECDLTRPLPFADTTFDTVLLSDVLEHLPNPAVVWAELHRICRSDGKILISVPFYYWLHEEPHDYHRYTSHGLRHYAQAAGFEVTQLEPLGGAPEVLTDVIGKHVQYIPLLGYWLARGMAALTRWFVAVPPGAWWSRASAKSFPLGYFMVVRKP